MEHGDPLLWWRLEPDAKAAAVGYLAAKGMDLKEANRKHKRKGRPSEDEGEGPGSPLFFPDLGS